MPTFEAGADGRVDDAGQLLSHGTRGGAHGRCVGRLVEARAAAPAPRGLIKSTTFCAASRTSWLTTSWSNSSTAASSTLAVSSRRCCSGGALGAPADHRRTSSSTSAESRNTSVASGIARRTERAPWMSISSSTLLPAAIASSTARRGVPHRYALCTVALSSSSPASTIRSNSSSETKVVLALDLARPRRASRRRDGELHVGVVLADVPSDGALADRGRAGEHDEAVAGAAVLGDPVGGELAKAPPLQAPEPAEALRRGDLELVHDPRALGLPDRRDRGEELGDAQAPLDALGLLVRGAQHVEWTAPTGGDVVLHGRAGAARARRRRATRRPGRPRGGVAMRRTSGPPISSARRGWPRRARPDPRRAANGLRSDLHRGRASLGCSGRSRSLHAPSRGGTSIGSARAQSVGDVDGTPRANRGAEDHADRAGPVRGPRAPATPRRRQMPATEPRLDSAAPPR